MFGNIALRCPLTNILCSDRNSVAPSPTSFYTPSYLQHLMDRTTVLQILAHLRASKYPYIPAFIQEWLTEAGIASKYPTIEAFWTVNISPFIATALLNESCRYCDNWGTSGHYYGCCRITNDSMYREEWCPKFTSDRIGVPRRSF